jgi:hypothetical protein
LNHRQNKKKSGAAGTVAIIMILIIKFQLFKKISVCLIFILKVRLGY